MLEAYITNLGKYNEGELVGEWLAFPTTQEKLDVALTRIGIGPEYEEYFFTDYNCDIEGVYDVLGEYESVHELNYLGHMLDEMGPGRRDEFEAVIDYEGARSVKDLINLAENLDNFSVTPEITTEQELGEYLVEEGIVEVPEHLLGYIDYEAVGRDAVLGGDGSLTNYGFVEPDGGFNEVYDGHDIPEEYDIHPQGLSMQPPRMEMKMVGGP